MMPLQALYGAHPKVSPNSSARELPFLSNWLQQPPPPPPVIVDGKPEYQVEEIQDSEVKEFCVCSIGGATQKLNSCGRMPIPDLVGQFHLCFPENPPPVAAYGGPSTAGLQLPGPCNTVPASQELPPVRPGEGDCQSPWLLCLLCQVPMRTQIWKRLCRGRAASRSPWSREGAKLEGKVMCRRRAHGREGRLNESLGWNLCTPTRALGESLLALTIS